MMRLTQILNGLGNDAELYGQRLKAFVEKSTLPVQGIDSYPDRRAGWGIFCLAEILQQ